MVYQVIGLMSGSSLDGLDICYAQYEETRGKWTAQIWASECIPYSTAWLQDLRMASQKSVPDFLKLHTAYGRYLGECVQAFIAQHELQHKVHFVASHGHTVFHEPQSCTTFQLGDGAAIAAVSGLPVISDLRNMDIALGGQGAPIVPIGDRLLFQDYNVLINIGGIANMTVRNATGKYIAFDVTIANQALNYLTQQLGKDYDENGTIAASGKLLANELLLLANVEYHQAAPPKSLSNEQAINLVRSFIENEQYAISDKLHTLCHFIALQIAASLQSVSIGETIVGKKAIATGGGAFNSFLMELIAVQLNLLGIELTIPDAQIIAYKEALVMGLIGTLRWREEVNVLADVTGAQRDSIGGAFWMGA
ncbi:MAG: anhydro-N-acetylmuramic acid kinase [Phycisphaerales bacterium]|nr:anhydro-N-acetylmuramic acid kinase [Phycisphaerales bacterium]